MLAATFLAPQAASGLHEANWGKLRQKKKATVRCGLKL